MEGSYLSRGTKKEFHSVPPFWSGSSSLLWHAFLCCRVARMFPTRWFVCHGLWVCFCLCTHTHTKHIHWYTSFFSLSCVKVAFFTLTLTKQEDLSKQLQNNSLCLGTAKSNVMKPQFRVFLKYQMHELTHGLVLAALVKLLSLHQTTRKVSPRIWGVVWVSQTHPCTLHEWGYKFPWLASKQTGPSTGTYAYYSLNQSPWLDHKCKFEILKTSLSHTHAHKTKGKNHSVTAFL